MWKSVDSATKSALWQTYICKDDVVGQRTIQKLLEAHQRGCETELLYDCGGNISGRWRLVERLRASGASVVAYRPFFRSLFRYLFKGFDWKRSPGLRNHRKILITDGTTGYCGGLNIGNEYCGRDEGGTGKFRDTHVRLEGPCVAHLQEVYNDTKNPHEWKFGWRRWRQIASARLNDTANEMNLQFIKPLKTATDQVKRRSGIFVRKQLTKDGEDPSKNKRLEKQRRQLLKLLKKYNPAAFEEVKETTPHEPEKPAAKTEFEELLKQKAATYSKTHLVDTEEGGPKPPISARRRKTLNAYYRAFKELSSLPHKRTYTQVLRELPLADTEAVPEAELYGKLRPSTTQVLSCNPRYKDYSIQYSMWQVTRKCHRRIWITTPYYLPNKKLFKALLHAAERGVDVRLLSGSNKTTDPWWMWHASNYITDRLLRAGVKIYEFKGSQIMHAKTVVVDSIWSSIGSYNWDVMSNRNLEVCLCHLDLEVAREMEEQFLKDLSESTEVQLEEHNKRSYLLRMASWMFYHGVYLLDKITFRAFCDQDLEDTPNIPEQR
ncbi:PLD-like domain containing protein, putative [Angomonas deanei]|uniref:PLD-like domain containing protein, putative n=1 Tax=Angomonas deanei TaxID=59799 RepID=A0A7G2C5Y6_9TRYP|nr:PLD-like domain containing protein, putative [Angomonas deanei]